MRVEDDFLIWAKQREIDTGDWLLLNGMENQEEYAREAWESAVALKNKEIEKLQLRIAVLASDYERVSQKYTALNGYD